MNEKPAARPPTPEEKEKAELYSLHVVNEIETALIGEIEVIEGRIPTNTEIAEHGVQRLNEDGSMDYLWKGTLIVHVNPKHVDAEGQRGVMLEMHKKVEEGNE